LRYTAYLRITIGVIFLVLSIMRGLWWWTVGFAALVGLVLLMNFQRRLDDHALAATLAMFALLILSLLGFGLGAAEFLGRLR
jgi:hypothetical protein